MIKKIKGLDKKILYLRSKIFFSRPAPCPSKTNGKGWQQPFHLKWKIYERSSSLTSSIEGVQFPLCYTAFLPLFSSYSQFYGQSTFLNCSKEAREAEQINNPSVSPQKETEGGPKVPKVPKVEAPLLELDETKRKASKTSPSSYIAVLPTARHSKEACEAIQKKPHGLIGRQRPLEVKQKISQSLKGVKKTHPSWLKGLTGPAHPAYIHGQGAATQP